MTAAWHKLLKPLALGLGLVALALLALAWTGTPPAHADAGPTCTVCLDGGCDYADIQAAVDDAGCTEIKVAQGVYTGVRARPAPSGYAYPYPPPWDGLITQVVYISRTVALRGGYTTTNWTVPDPWAQPTTLDAGGLGRVMVIAGDISPTIEGLGLTNGKAIRLGGDPSGTSGGGVYVLSATATLSASRVFSNLSFYGGGLYLAFSPATLSANSVTANTADYGGGLYLQSSNATLSANSVTGNTANHSGGGLYLLSSNATLTANAVNANIAAISNFSVGFGGGLYLHHSPATLSANSVASNTAHVYGGGLYLDSSAATLTANSVTANTAAQGGGLFMDYSPAWLSANSVTSNTANSAGGLFVFYSNATFTNTVVAGNRGRDRSSGLFISGGSYVPPSETRLLHTTIAGNWGGDGSGLYVVGAGTVWLTDTILVRQTLGITVAAGSTATMNSTLWYANGADWSGAGTFDHSGDTTGDPAFVDPGGGDYHIGPASAAIDRGVAAGVTTDKDGRPRDAEPDLGAYEAPTLRMTKSVDRDPAPAGAALTYTVLVTNDLDTPQVVTAFDVLPGQVGGLSGDSLPAADLPPDILDLLGGAVDPAAVVAYSTTTVAPGATWAWPIPDLVVQPGYSGTLTNTVALTSATGRHALYVLASTAVVLAPADTYTYLPVIMKASR